AIEYAGFRFVAAVFSALPLEFASALSGGIWRLIAPQLPRHRRALDNLAAAYPEKTPEEREAIALAMWENLGRVFAEFFHLDELVAGDRIVLEASPHFDSLRAVARAAVVCGMHTGNWEIVVVAALRTGFKPAGVYQKIVNPLVDEYVRRIRAPLYPGGLLDKSSRTAVQLLRYTKNGGCAAFLADQRESRGLPVPFFGRPAPSTPFPALIAATHDLPLYAFRVKRENGVRFSIKTEPVAVQRSGDRNADVAATTAALQATYERFIREAPEQWMWAHRRWA
ncbi:MAG TPA: lauroyl acyltransferase, partial [Roseiarcus sp.]|nr:lauroyl acyltransferase [Roseiarcus sp.]